MQIFTLPDALSEFTEIHNRTPIVVHWSTEAHGTAWGCVRSSTAPSLRYHTRDRSLSSSSTHNIPSQRWTASPHGASSSWSGGHAPSFSSSTRSHWLKCSI